LRASQIGFRGGRIFEQVVGMKTALFLALFFILAGPGFALADKVNPALVQQILESDCVPASVFNSLMLTPSQEPILKHLQGGTPLGAYSNFLTQYGKDRFDAKEGASFRDVTNMANELLEDSHPTARRLTFKDLKKEIEKFDLQRLDQLYQEIETSFQRGFNPVVGVSFFTEEGQRKGGHAVVVYKVDLKDEGLILTYLDPQNLSIENELLVGPQLKASSQTLYSNSKEPTPHWTLDKIILSR